MRKKTLQALSDKTRQLWRGLLTSEAGLQGLAFLREDMSPIRSGPGIEPHHVQMDAGFQNGYKKALEDLWEKLAEEPPRQQSEETPTLHDTRTED